jgi:hypothetical protein
MLTGQPEASDSSPREHWLFFAQNFVMGVLPSRLPVGPISFLTIREP